MLVAMPRFTWKCTGTRNARRACRQITHLMLAKKIKTSCMETTNIPFTQHAEKLHRFAWFVKLAQHTCITSKLTLPLSREPLNACPIGSVLLLFVYSCCFFGMRSPASLACISQSERTALHQCLAIMTRSALGLAYTSERRRATHADAAA